MCHGVDRGRVGAIERRDSRPLASAGRVDERGNTMEAASVAIELMESFNKSRLGADSRPVLTRHHLRSRRARTGPPRGSTRSCRWPRAGRQRSPTSTATSGPAPAAGNIAVLEITWTGTNDGPIEMANGTLPGHRQSRRSSTTAQIYDGRGWAGERVPELRRLHHHADPAGSDPGLALSDHPLAWADWAHMRARLPLCDHGHGAGGALLPGAEAADPAI